MSVSLSDLQREVADLKRRIVELERKEVIRTRRLRKFTDIARQAAIIFLGAVEDLGNIKRTIPSRKDRRTK